MSTECSKLLPLLIDIVNVQCKPDLLQLSRVTHDVLK